MTSFWKAAAAAAEDHARVEVIKADCGAEPAERRSIRREPPRPEPVPAPTEDLLRLRLGEELDYARRVLDGLGDRLSSDSAIVCRHGVHLQSLDIVGQMLGHFAEVIRSSDPEAAVERIGMAELKSRLKRRGAL